MLGIARLAIVLALVALDLGFALPDIVRPISPLGDLGFSTVNNVVTAAVPDGPAARANIQRLPYVRVTRRSFPLL
jgi:hypothetical protein